MERNREQTKQKIIDAVNHVVREGGIKALGINAISRQAGVSKVLIYRYFGNLKGLLDAWAQSNSYWVQTARGMQLEDIGKLDTASKKKLTADIFRRHLLQLRENPVMRELLRWQLREKNEICSRFSEETEKRSKGI